MSFAFKSQLSSQALEQFYALENSLLSPAGRRSEGAVCYLNINHLSQLFWFLKENCFTQQERMNMNDHQIQVFLIELCQIKRRNVSLERIIEEIMNHIHETSRYWNDYSPQHIELRKIETLSETCRNKEAISISFRILEDIISNAFEIERVRNPFEIYREYLEDFQKHRRGEVLSQKKPDVELGISEIHNFFTSDQCTADKQSRIDNLIRSIREKPQHININGLLISERRISRRNQSSLDAKGLELYDKYLDKRESIEEEYKVDLGEYEKIDYSKSMRFNAQMYRTPKINLGILRIVFLFVNDKNFELSNRNAVLDVEKEKIHMVVRASEVFEYRLQNFIMFLGMNRYHIGELYSGKKFNHIEFYNNHISPKGLDEEKALIRFFKYVQSNNFDLDSLKDNPSNPEKHIFLRNLILLAELFSVCNDPDEDPAAIIADLVSSRSKMEANIGKIQETLEKHTDFPLETRKQIIFRYVTEKEKIDRNSARLVNYLSMHKLNKNDQFEKAIEAYKVYCGLDETKIKKRYMFFEDSNFNWTPEQFKKFLIGLRTYRDDVINNRKISSFIGSGTQVNHVKYIKGLYTRCYSKEAKKRKIPLDVIIDEHIAHFSEDVFSFLENSPARKKVKLI
jgi:hypothetical protein